MRGLANAVYTAVHLPHTAMETRQRLESILNALRESREKAIAAIKKAEAVIVQDRIRNPCRDPK